MFERVLGLFRQERDQTRQEQREALLDLLVLAMFVDRHVAWSEGDLILKEARALPWEAGLPYEHFIDSSKRRARGMLDNHIAQDAYLLDISRRLGSDEMRARAYDACVVLVGVDNKRTDEELDLLERVRERLGITG